jgi:hypothetical protein
VVITSSGSAQPVAMNRLNSSLEGRVERASFFLVGVSSVTLPSSHARAVPSVKAEEKRTLVDEVRKSPRFQMA